MEMRHTARRAGRLSSILRGEMGLSAGLMNRLKWKNRLLVNGEPQHTDFLVQPGDEITALLDEPVPEYPAEQGPLTVLYEDEFLLAVDKPAGMLIHPSTSRITGTLANRVAGYYERTGQHCAFHPVTRLDRDTFGLALLAKNAHVHALMNELHRRGGLDKRYHAWVFGGPAADSGRIDLPIARLPLPSLLRRVQEDGKPSVTDFWVLERREKVCKLELRPVTGRTHQLRVHCAYMGYPILGDPQYGSGESLDFSQKMGLETQLLCAKSLTFTHPITGELLKIQSNMDASL